MLKHQKVIVTGAASGIGKAVVKQCLHEGASVIACDINAHALSELLNEMDNHPDLCSYTLDVRRYNEVAAFFSEMAEKKPTALVNNAGIYLGKSLLDYSPEEIEKVLSVNIKGYIYFTQEFGKHLFQKKDKGAIVNVSPVSGIEGSSDAVYGCSKAAINFSPTIRVNAIAPTMVLTPMVETIPEWRRKEYLSKELIQSPVLPEDVAHTVTSLLSDKAKHYTGATFDIYNGVYLR